MQDVHADEITEWCVENIGASAASSADLIVEQIVNSNRKTIVNMRRLFAKDLKLEDYDEEKLSITLLKFVTAMEEGVASVRATLSAYNTNPEKDPNITSVQLSTKLKNLKTSIKGSYSKLVTGMVGRFSSSSDEKLSKEHLHWAALVVFESRRVSRSKVPDPMACPTDVISASKAFMRLPSRTQRLFASIHSLFLASAPYLAEKVEEFETA